ncbi:MAG TPA: 3'-5' exonuclease, partial [Spirochaetota bacterium]
MWENSDLTLAGCEFCALDIETTGINPYAARLIEIGIVIFTMEKIIAEYQTLVNPGTHIPEQVEMIHGISDDMVANAPSIDGVIDEIIAFIGDRPLVIHNSKFDLSFLEMECRRSNREIPPWVSFDTVILARKTFPGFLNHKLDTLCGIFGIPLSHHRALQDAFGCMEVFRRCVRE